MSGAGYAVADGVALDVHDGDFPAGVRGPGRCRSEVPGHGRVEVAEQPVVTGPLRSSVQGCERNRHLGQRQPGACPVWTATAAARPRGAVRIPAVTVRSLVATRAVGAATVRPVTVNAVFDAAA